jgi:hypothetical protein
MDCQRMSSCHPRRRTWIERGLTICQQAQLKPTRNSARRICRRVHQVMITPTLGDDGDCCFLPQNRRDSLSGCCACDNVRPSANENCSRAHGHQCGFGRGAESDVVENKLLEGQLNFLAAKRCGQAQSFLATELLHAIRHARPANMKHARCWTKDLIASEDIPTWSPSATAIFPSCVMNMFNVF